MGGDPMGGQEVALSVRRAPMELETMPFVAFPEGHSAAQAIARVTLGNLSSGHAWGRAVTTVNVAVERAGGA